MTSSVLPIRPQSFPALDVTPRQELALLARILHAEGYDDHLAGHITYRQPDGTFLVNPLGLSWDELCASDVARMDAQGNQMEGRWTISPAVLLHIVLHEHRDNAGVVIHNHPRWGTIWADSHRIPPVYDQTSALYGGKIAIDTTYAGPVNQTANAVDVVTALGDADVAFMVNHGVLIIGRNIREAYLRAAVVEWRCRQAWHVEALGSGIPLPDEVVLTFGSQIANSVAKGNFDNWFAAAARRVVRHDPAVLD
jgi:ribulose-5-phosphate 4-epimerase/fuculose-1-phosphate aldolase